MPEAPRRIIHVDMDAFYASVELLRYPELRGQPLVIGGRRRLAQDESGGTAFPALRDYKGRGVITTATYEARAFGLHSGMALMRAAKLAPDALLLPADFDEYRRYSRMFKDAVRAVAPRVEDRGIDEIYVDLTDLVSPPTDTPDAWARAGRPHALDRALRRKAWRLDARGRERSRRPAGPHLQRAEIDQPRNDLRKRPAPGARPRRALGHLHRAVRAARGRPREKRLRRADDRTEAALRQLQDAHPRLHARCADARRGRH